ncbi:MAG: hypothetical protein AB1Z22_04820 [Synechococcaceae cyanobacterium]
MSSQKQTLQRLSLEQPRRRLQRWQVARTWARLIREAERLWSVDARTMHRLAAQELLALLQEVPPGLRRRVNRWLQRFGALTRLNA